jgi:hypothetical protein
MYGERARDEVKKMWKKAGEKERVNGRSQYLLDKFYYFFIHVFGVQVWVKTGKNEGQTFLYST